MHSESESDLALEALAKSSLAPSFDNLADSTEAVIALMRQFSIEAKDVDKALGSIIDYSVNSTLARSINTTSTLIFVMVAMLLLGGQTIFYFVLALLVGVTVGTYSSIFIGSPLLVTIAKWTKKS